MTATWVRDFRLSPCGGGGRAQRAGEGLSDTPCQRALTPLAALLRAYPLPQGERVKRDHIDFAAGTMSLVAMTVAAQGNPSEAAATAEANARRWSRLLRPALGLALPVGLALAWEFIVRMGWGSGRLAPPPSV